nr:3B [Kobuvirus cattle/Kagoshima-1-22-KoV/2014/JPN]
GAYSGLPQVARAKRQVKKPVPAPRTAGPVQRQ